MGRLLKLYGAASFTPSSISGLQAWYSARNPASLYQDIAQTTASAANGDPVGAWQDLSGNGRHAVTSSDADRPTYRPSAAMGGKPSLQFDGSGDRLLADTIATACSGTGQAWSIFIVGQQTSSTRYAVSLGNSGSTTQTMYFTFVDGSSQSLLLLRNNANTSTTRTVSTATTATPYICTLSYTGSAATLRRNGTESASGSLSGTFTFDRFTLGTLRRVSESETSFLGHISEVLVYAGSALDSASVAYVERNLGILYGIAVP
jgi:hypothetical protein